MDFTILPFEYEGRYTDLYKDMGLSMEQAAVLEDRDRQLEDYLASLDTGGGGEIPFLVASVNASDEMKAAASYQCDGTDDDVQVAAAIAAATATYGSRVILSEGYFGFSSTVTVGAVILQGSGAGMTLITTSASTGITMAGYSSLRDLSLTGPNSAGSIGVDITDDHDTIENCEFYNAETVIRVSSAGTDARIANSNVAGGASTVNAISVGGARALITGNYIGYDITLSSNEAMVVDNRFDPARTVTVASGSRNMFAHNYLSNGLADFSDSGTTTMRGTNFSNTGTW